MSGLQDGTEQNVFSSAPQPQSTCLLIVGMHRSGTSALARVLSLLGADLPNTLMDGTAANKASNASGHWESEAAARLGDMILDSAGTDWRSPEPVAASWYNSVRYRDMRERAIALLHEEFGNSPLFVFKDPRVCKLLPFWLDALDRFGSAPRIASILRSPLEVAASLRTRNGFDLMLGQILWLRYVLDGEAASRSVPRVFVTYDQLLNNTAALARRIGEDLGVIWPRSSVKTNSVIANFVSTTHRHHVHEPDPLSDQQSGFPSRQAKVYSILSQWARAGEDTKHHQELDSTKLEFDHALSLLAEPIHLALNQTAQIKRFKGREAEQAAALKSAQDNAHSLTEAIETLTKSEADRATALTELEDARNSIASLEIARAEISTQRLEERIIVARTEEKLLASESARLETKNQASQLQTQLKEALNSNRELLANLHANELKLVRSEMQLAITESDLKTQRAIAEELKHTHERMRQVEEDLANQHRIASETENLLREQQTEIETLREGHARRSAELDRALLKISAAVEERAAQAADMQNTRSMVKDLQSKLAEQTDIATRRLSAIEHLREDRARKVAERDVRSRKLLAQIEELQGQLSIAYAPQPPKPDARPFKARISRLLHIKGSAATHVRNERLATIRSSNLFDPWWYLAKYDDVRSQGLDPAEHYLDHGGLEGRSPSTQFDGRWYLQTNADVSEAGFNPLLHYIEHGKLEGRQIRSLSEAKRQNVTPVQRFASAAQAHAPSPDANLTPPKIPIPTATKASHDAPWFSRRLTFSHLGQTVDLGKHGPVTDLSSGGDLVEVDRVVVANAPQSSALEYKAIYNACRLSAALGRLSPGSDINQDTEGASLDNALRMQLCGDTLALKDAWFNTPSQLRLRFHAKSGTRLLFVRSFQHDAEDGLSPCGESALSANGHSIIDVRLHSHYRPLLLVVVDMDGRLADSMLLPFPSLLRGGAHYGEAPAVDDGASALAAANSLARRLLEKHIAACSTDAAGAISKVEIDICGANGTEAALAGDLLSWLIKDLGVCVATSKFENDDPTHVAINDGIQALGAPLNPRGDGATLHLPANAIPSLSVLFARGDEVTDDVSQSIYMHSAERLASHSLTQAAAPRLDAEPNIPNFSRLAMVSDAKGLTSHPTIPLAICWPHDAPLSAAQAFFPAGSDLSLSAQGVNKAERPLSVIIDCSTGTLNIAPLLMSVARLGDQFDLDCIVINPGFPLPSDIGMGVQSTQSADASQMVRILAASKLCKADRIFLLDESIILHDPRIGAALWNAGSAPGIGTISCALVSESAGVKGASRLHMTAGWIIRTGIDQPVCYSKTNLLDYTLPPLLPVVAGDLRCAMIDKSVLQKLGEVENELSFGLALNEAGLTNICLTFVVATSSTQMFAEVETGNTTIPKNALHLRNFLR